MINMAVLTRLSIIWSFLWRGNKLQLMVVIIVLSPLSILSVSAVDGQSKNATNLDAGDELKAYDDVRNDSGLYNLIIEKQFSRALERLNEMPQESRTLINVLGGTKGKEVIQSGLPLHFAFLVDIPENLSTAQRQNVMSQDKSDLVVALIKANPLAVAQLDKNGRFPLHLALLTPVPPPAKVIKVMLQLFPKSASILGNEGRTPLHMAVSYPMTTFENVQEVLAAWPEAVEVQDEDESLPIHLASWGGNFHDSRNVVELLLNQNPRHISVTDADDETPLSIMANYGRASKEAVEFILQKDPTAPARFRDEVGGNSLLHYAVVSSMQQNSSGYKPFLEHNKDLLKSINRLGQLPLHLALQRCCASPEMIFDLIEGFPQAASNRDGYGFLPIHHACNSGVRSSEIVRSLIKMSPESVKSEATTSRNSRGPLPLHFALAHQSEAGDRVMDNVIELLLHEYPQGSKIKDPDSDVLPIHAAFLSKRSASVLKTLMTLSPHELSTMSEIQEDGQKKTTSTLHLFSAQCHSYMSVEEIMEVIQLFQRIKPSLFKQKDSDGRLPLHVVWKQTETIEESRQALVAALLDEHPDAVYAKDNADNTPLSYIARAKDVYSFDKIFPMNPFAAAIMSKEEGMYPLHKLCGFGVFGNFSEAFDKMLTALIQQYPEAAGVSDENGNLPLHSLCKTAGSFHAEKHTIQKLVQAYPNALNATDASGMFPLQLVVAAATDSDDTQEHRHWLNFSDLLIELNPAVASTVENGLLPLRTVLDRMETLSIDRRNNDDHVLQLVTRLYDTFPGAIRWHASRKQNGLHSLAILVGDLGGATPKGWSDFVVRVIQDFPELSKEKDTHERTPLHVLSLYLGDTGLLLRENQDPRTTVWTAALDEVFLELLRANVDAMDTKDEYGLLPIDIIQHDRLRYAKGGRRYYQSAIVNQMKAYLRRGHGYWRMKVAIQDAKSCGALRSTLTRLRHELQNHLVEFDIQSITEPFACDGEEMSICQRCIDEQELLGEVDLLLSTYAKVMEERGRDASEISGEYTSY